MQSREPLFSHHITGDLGKQACRMSTTVRDHHSNPLLSELYSTAFRLIQWLFKSLKLALMGESRIARPSKQEARQQICHRQDTDPVSVQQTVCYGVAQQARRSPTPAAAAWSVLMRSICTAVCGSPIAQLPGFSSDAAPTRTAEPACFSSCRPRLPSRAVAAADRPRLRARVRRRRRRCCRRWHCCFLQLRRQPRGRRRSAARSGLQLPWRLGPKAGARPHPRHRLQLANL